MPTLYVENVPKELYEALRARAQQKRNSISAEVLSLLQENVMTEAEWKSRQHFLRQTKGLRSRKTASARRLPSAEEMQREDRLR